MYTFSQAVLCSASLCCLTPALHKAKRLYPWSCQFWEGQGPSEQELNYFIKVSKIKCYCSVMLSNCFITDMYICPLKTQNSRHKSFNWS